MENKLMDMEGHEVHLIGTPNNHILNLGKSGMGKTFAANREVAHRVENGDKVAILDLTGSYTLEELEKAGNVLEKEDTCYIRLDRDTITFPIYGEDILGAIIDAMTEAFEVTSYNQRRILKECCEEVLEELGVFTFSELFKKLDSRYRLCQIGDSEEYPDELKNTGYLLSRFQCFEKMGNISFLEDGVLRQPEKRKSVTVLQLSYFSEIQKCRLSSFFLSVIWTNARCRRKSEEVKEFEFDAVLLDEFQHIALKKDSSFNAILREGRKFGFSAILCTQCLNDRKKDELSALMQVGTVLLFRPTENEIKLLMDMFHLGEYRVWKKILLELDVGQAILIGSYKLDNGGETNTPIIVRIEGKEEKGNDEEFIDFPVKMFVQCDLKDDVLQNKRGRGTVTFRR